MPHATLMPRSMANDLERIFADLMRMEKASEVHPFREPE